MALRFDDQFLKKLEYLHVVSKRAFAGHNRADRLTAHRGRGLEFADHRPYTAGDDFRHIDWKAYKRLGRLLLRLVGGGRAAPRYPLLAARRAPRAGGGPSRRSSTWRAGSWRRSATSGSCISTS